jgi:hypothetical protein
MQNRNPPDANELGAANWHVPLAEIETTAQPPPGCEDMADRRRERIQQHLAVTLQSEGTWPACLGPVSCDLLEMLQNLKQDIDAAYATGPLASERFQNLKPAIELYARVTNLVYKLAHLDHSLRSSKAPR